MRSCRPVWRNSAARSARSSVETTSSQDSGTAMTRSHCPKLRSSMSCTAGLPSRRPSRNRSRPVIPSSGAPFLHLLGDIARALEKDGGAGQCLDGRRVPPGAWAVDGYAARFEEGQGRLVQVAVAGQGQPYAGVAGPGTAPGCAALLGEMARLYCVGSHATPSALYRPAASVTRWLVGFPEVSTSTTSAMPRPRA